MAKTNIINNAAASFDVDTTIVAGTNITSTAGNITASAGNLVATSGLVAMPVTNAAIDEGAITLGGARFMHARGTDNVFLGSGAGNATFTVSGSENNVVIGANALDAMSTNCRNNVAIGYNAMTAATDSRGNVAIGYLAMLAVQTQTANTAIGQNCLQNVTTGTGNNTGLGNSALNTITTGSFNLALGNTAGTSLTTSNSSNILLLNNGTSGDNNIIRIGTQGTGNGQQNQAFIAGIVGATTGGASTVPYIETATGKISTIPGGAVTLNTATQSLSISSDASATTVNVGTGAAAKAVTVGSTNTTSALTLNSGSGGIKAIGVYGASVAGLPVQIDSSGNLGTSTLTTPVSFNAYASATVTNVTGDGTFYQCVFNTAIFNNSSAYNAATGLFTAPISGLYLLNTTVGASNLGAGHTLGNVQLVTTGRTFTSDYSNYFAESSGGIFMASQSRLVFLNATDTAYVRLNVLNSTKTVGLYGGNVNSSFSGYLIVPSIVPSQVSFSAYNASNPTNVTGDGTAYTVAYDTTVFNTGSGFNTGTYTFTAPNTGIYQFNVTVGGGTLGAGHTLGNVQLVTTGATYTSNYASYGPIRASNNLYIASFSQLVSMTAGNTAYVVLTISGSTKTVGLYGGNVNSSFSGVQIA